MRDRRHRENHRPAEPAATPEAPVGTGSGAAAGLLDLQRRAGNSAVVQLLQRSTAGGDDADTIRRSVGFEFEIEVPIVQPGNVPGGVPPGMVDTYRWITGAGLAAKAPIRAPGTYPAGGYKVEADHGVVSNAMRAYQSFFVDDAHVGGQVRNVVAGFGPGILEFVTAPLNEQALDYETQLADQLAPLQQEMLAIQGEQPDDHLHQRYGMLVGVPEFTEAPLFDVNEVPGERMEVVGGLYEQVAQAAQTVRNLVSFASDPQATVGIDLTEVTGLVGRVDPQIVSGDHEEVVELTNEAWTTVRGLVDDGLDVLEEEQPEVRVTGADLRAVDGFLKVLTQYVVGNAHWECRPDTGSTPKNLTPFWLTLDPGLYQQALPPNARTVIGIIADAVRGRLVTISNGLRLDWPPLRTGIPDVGAFLAAALAGQYTGFQEPPRPGTDDLGGGRRGVPIEFRSISDTPEPDELYDFALGIAEKVRAINNPEPLD